MTLARALPRACPIGWLLALLCAPLAGRANDFPTVDRVLYVHECMRNHPGPHFEMVNKCACAVDKLAEVTSFEDYVTMSTAANATTIGGERGSTIRDAGNLQALAKHFRELQAQVQKACFLTPP